MCWVNRGAERLRLGGGALFLLTLSLSLSLFLSLSLDLSLVLTLPPSLFVFCRCAFSAPLGRHGKQCVCVFCCTLVKREEGRSGCLKVRLEE